MVKVPSEEATVSRSVRLLSFGIYTADKPTEVFKQFRPILDQAEKALSKALGQTVRVEIDITPSYEEGRRKLIEGEVDFARFGPASYVLAKKANPEIQILALELKKGKKRFKGVICVRKDSPIQAIEDLRGKRFAFGDPTSTIGRYLSQKLLLDHGIDAKALAEYRYFGRHDKVATEVLYEGFDAGALKESTFKKYQNEGAGLRKLVDFDNITKPWLARAGLEPKIVEAMRQFLVHFKDPEALKKLKASGFALAEDSEFDFIREAMERAKDFDVSALGIEAR